MIIHESIFDQVFVKSPKKSKQDEFEKCKKNPVYFIETYCLVPTVAVGKTKVKLYPWQKKAITAYICHGKNIIAVQKRCAGKSFVIKCIILHLLVFSHNSNICLNTRQPFEAKQMVQKIVEMWNDVSPSLKLDLGALKIDGLKLNSFNENKLQICVSDDLMRGTGFTDIFFDEAAYNPKFAEILPTGLTSIISNSGSVFIASTPNVGSYFNSFVKMAHEKLKDSKRTMFCLKHSGYFGGGNRGRLKKSH